MYHNPKSKLFQFVGRNTTRKLYLKKEVGNEVEEETCIQEVKNFLMTIDEKLALKATNCW